MDDDFNTPLALAHLFDLVTYINKFISSKDVSSADIEAFVPCAREMIIRLSVVFGLDLTKQYSSQPLDEERIRRMIGDRDRARKAKDFKKSDEIRNELAALGVIIEDTKDGTTWRAKV